MALVLTIPGVVDSQDLQSMHAEPDGVSFELTFEYNTTAIEVMKTFERGDKYDLVVLTTDSGILGLDDVYVASASFAGGSSPTFACSMQARAVRWV